MVTALGHPHQNLSPGIPDQPQTGLPSLGLPSPNPASQSLSRRDIRSRFILQTWSPFPRLLHLSKEQRQPETWVTPSLPLPCPGCRPQPRPFSLLASPVGFVSDVPHGSVSLRHHIGRAHGAVISLPLRMMAPARPLISCRCPHHATLPPVPRSSQPFLQQGLCTCRSPVSSLAPAWDSLFPRCSQDHTLYGSARKSLT